MTGIKDALNAFTTTSRSLVQAVGLNTNPAPVAQASGNSPFASQPAVNLTPPPAPALSATLFGNSPFTSQANTVPTPPPAPALSATLLQPNVIPAAPAAPL